MTEAVRRQLAAAGARLPAERPKAAPAPIAAAEASGGRTAQINATIGQPGVQVWQGVDGQGSVLRFFDLSAADKAALLAAAAERGIHPVRR